MKKTSIYLEPELDRALTRYATARGISKAEAIRRAIADVVEAPRPRIAAIGVGEGPGDLAERHDDYLRAGFGSD